MGNQAWADILEAIYEEEITFQEFPTDAEDDNIKQLSRVTGHDPEVVTQKLSVLEEWGLVGQIPVAGGGIHSIGLTEEGFRVAHERELRKQQQKLVKQQNTTSEEIASLTEDQAEATGITATFTVILGITALVQATAAVFQADRYWWVLALIYIIMLLLFYWIRDDWILTTKSSGN